MRLYGALPANKLVAVGATTDIDDTGQSVHALCGDIRFLRTP
jgi:hypothetical protein